jgi:hypothetical protein
MRGLYQAYDISNFSSTFFYKPSLPFYVVVRSNWMIAVFLYLGLDFYFKTQEIKQVLRYQFIEL